MVIKKNGWAVFLMLVIGCTGLVMVMWIDGGTELPKPVSSASDNPPEAAPPAPQPSGSSSRSKRWRAVLELLGVEGTWSGGSDSWLTILARGHHEDRNRKYGGIYPWYLRYWPGTTRAAEDGFKAPLECGIYELVHQDVRNPELRGFRAGFCWGGDQVGDEAYAERFVILINENGHTLDVSFGSKYSAEFNSRQAYEATKDQ